MVSAVLPWSVMWHLFSDGWAVDRCDQSWLCLRDGARSTLTWVILTPNSSNIEAWWSHNMPAMKLGQVPSSAWCNCMINTISISLTFSFHVILGFPTFSHLPPSHHECCFRLDVKVKIKWIFNLKWEECLSSREEQNHCRSFPLWKI